MIDAGSKGRRRTRKRDDELAEIAASDAEQGDWTMLKLWLSMGWERPRGIRLTQAECWILHEILDGKRKFPSRRDGPDLEAENRAKHFATYSLLLELTDGMQAEPAIAMTRDRYGASRSSVFAARNRWMSEIRPIFEQMSPEQLRGMRLWFEHPGASAFLAFRLAERSMIISKLIGLHSESK